MATPELVGKLTALHDIVVPPPVPWWPPAPGWYVVFALGAALVGWLIWHAYRHWRANAYRRIALRRLVSVRAELADPSHRASALTELAALVRRAVLHAAPRERVAALSGDAWLAFLDAGIGGDAFRSNTGKLMISGPYQPANTIANIPRADLEALCGIVERWLRKHRVTRDANIS